MRRELHPKMLTKGCIIHWVDAPRRRNLWAPADPAYGPDGPLPEATPAHRVHRATMLTRTARNPALVRTAALLGAVLLAMNMGSAIRKVMPLHVRDTMRALAPSTPGTRPPRWRGRMGAPGGSAGAALAPKLSRRWVRVLWTWPFPLLPRVVALVGRPHGADAASGIQRRKKWAGIGGHGRHGAG